MNSNLEDGLLESNLEGFIFVEDGTASMMSIHSIPTQSLVTCILIGLAGVVGLVGCLIMLRAMIKYPNLRINMYVLMTGLAVADMLHLLTAVPAHIVDLTRQTPYFEYADEWCKASEFFKSATSYSVAFHLVGMAVMRGVMRTKRGYTPTNCRLGVRMTALCSTMAVLASIPTAVIYTYSYRYEYCIATSNSSFYQEIWAKSLFACFLPLLCTVAIFGFTHNLTKRYFADSYSRRERRTSKMVTAVIIAFAILNIPYFIMNLYIYYFTKLNPEKIFDLSNLLYAKDFLLCLTIADKALRPVLYSKLAPNLDRCFDEVINCTMCSRQYATQDRRRRQRRRHPAGTQGSHVSQSSRVPLTTSTNPTGIAETPSETL